jgi:hypothetical protein
MKYRIFELKVDLLENNPLRTPQRTTSLALGYTCADSLETAQSLLMDSAAFFGVKITEMSNPIEYPSLSALNQPRAIPYLEGRDGRPTCYIAPFERGYFVL